MNKSKILFLILFLLSPAVVQAQQTISVNTTAEASVPADRIAFHIELNAESETPQNAYTIHKQREKVLVRELKAHHITEKHIQFEPVSIRRSSDRRPRQSKQEMIQTSQSVTVTIEDFNLYEEIQLTLIENGFDRFSGRFISTKSKDAKDRALEKALNQARQKANIIARATGVNITGIKEIHYSHNQAKPYHSLESATRNPSDDLLDYAQKVSISASVSVTYKFK